MYKGKRVDLKEFPYFVTPIFNQTINWYQANIFPSGGALIDPRWVITGARWANHYDTELSVRVALGLSSFNGVDLGTAGSPVKNYFYHPLRKLKEAKNFVGLIEIPHHMKPKEKPLALPLPGDDSAFIDSNHQVTLVSMGPTFSYNLTTKPKDYGRVLKTATASISRSHCSRRAKDWIYWGKERWHDLDVAPQQVCIVFHPPSKRDFSKVRSKFILCEDDCGGLALIKPRGEPVLGAIMTRQTTVRCGVGIDHRWILWKQAQHLVRIEPHMAFILHTIDSSPTIHQLESTMDAWMAHPNILSRFLSQDHDE